MIYQNGDTMTQTTPLERLANDVWPKVYDDLRRKDASEAFCRFEEALERAYQMGRNRTMEASWQTRR